MQSVVRSLAIALALPLFSLAAEAQTSFPFRVNQASSNFTWTGTSTLGAIVGNPSNTFQLLGTQNIDLVLQTGAQPFVSGAFTSGVITTSTALHGKINNPIPFLPPLATIDVNNLALTASSPTFTVGAGGAMSASITLTALGGQLVVTPLAGSATSTDLTGAASAPTVVNGTLTSSTNVFTLNGPINSTFAFSDPTSGASGTISLVGTLVANFNLVQTFCVGDGTGTACPCANNSPAGGGRGCLNSTGVGGRLTTTGAPVLTADTLVLQGSGMPATATGLYFQGTTQLGGGAGAVFGDGLRCAGGIVIRLGPKTASAGASSYPGVGDASVSVKGLVATPASTLNYQLWYRDSAAFCSASFFNLTNGIAVTWIP